VKKLVMLAMAAVVALLIVVPTAMAQTTLPTTGGQAELPTTGGQAELPTTGGPSLLLPAAALLLSSGVVVGYVALRCR
jgi:hypothetical protein